MSLVTYSSSASLIWQRMCSHGSGRDWFTTIQHLALSSKDTFCFCRLLNGLEVQRDSRFSRKLKTEELTCCEISSLLFLSFLITGSADLPQGHESRHLCSPQPQSLQRASGFPAGQWRMPASAGHGVPDHPLRSWWPHLPRRRECGQPLLRGVGVTGGHPGWRSGGYSRSEYFYFYYSSTINSSFCLCEDDIFVLSYSTQSCCCFFHLKCTVFQFLFGASQVVSRSEWVDGTATSLYRKASFYLLYFIPLLLCKLFFNPFTTAFQQPLQSETETRPSQSASESETRHSP